MNSNLRHAAMATALVSAMIFPTTTTLAQPVSISTLPPGAINNIQAQVAANKTVIDSALVLIAGIADRIKAAGTDPTKLAELTASLKSEDDALSAAIVTNTPAA